MGFVFQRGQDYSGFPRDGYRPKLLKILPPDISSLNEGDWIYSENLGGWIGQESDRNKEIYDKRIAIA